jgi:hypothetical protein
VRQAWPFDVQQTLGLGIRLEPEQLWMYDQPKGHAMAIWLPQDPEHEAQCTEGCNFPLTLQDDSLLVVPLPVKYDEAEAWTRQEADEHVGDLWKEWPTIICQVGGEYHGNLYNWQPYRLWDLWPITSGEYEGLKRAQDALFDALAMWDRTLMAEFQFGDYSIWDEIESSDLIDHELLDKLEEQDDVDGRMEYLEGIGEQYINRIGDRITATEHLWTPEHVGRLLDLDSLGLWESWERLRATSRSAWRTVERSVPSHQRLAYMMQQKWINPWP